MLMNKAEKVSKAKVQNMINHYHSQVKDYYACVSLFELENWVRISERIIDLNTRDLEAGMTSQAKFLSSDLIGSFKRLIDQIAKAEERIKFLKQQNKKTCAYLKPVF